MEPLSDGKGLSMAFEMICGQCRGNLLVEQFGVVVACPHCGAHLSIPAPTPPAAVSVPAPAPAPVPTQTPALQPVFVPEPQPVAVQPVVPPAPEPVVEPIPVPPIPDPQLIDDLLPFFGTALIETPIPVEVADVSAVSPEPPAIVESPDLAVEAAAESPDSQAFSLESLTAPAEEPAAPVAEVPSAEVPAVAATEPTEVVAVPESSTGLSGILAASEPAATAGAVEIAEPIPESTSAVASETHVTEEAHAEETHIASPSTIVPAKTEVAKPDKDHVLVSRLFLMFLMSYSSALTLGFGYLLYNQGPKPSNYGIESLPDVEPPKAKNGKKISFLQIPEDAEMPPQHDLEIGDSQRYGNIKVTVLKVTRGPLKFIHFKTREPRAIPTSPVLKLWLKFENISKDQDIAPLDARLLFSRKGDILNGWKANQFVCRKQHKGNPDTLKVLAFDHAFQGEWDLAGMLLSKPLAPGESREYYIPTAENDLEKLQGELLWRVHCRKGFGPKGNGVTTVFEVLFNSNDIQPENA